MKRKSLMGFVPAIFAAIVALGSVAPAFGQLGSSTVLYVPGRLTITGSDGINDSCIVEVHYDRVSMEFVERDSDGNVIDTDLWELPFHTHVVDEIVFYGHGGDDLLMNLSSIPCYAYGGTGDDTLIGGTGNDFLDGDEGNDFIKGRAGRDFVIGGLGDDILRTGEGEPEFATIGGGDSDIFSLPGVEDPETSAIVGVEIVGYTDFDPVNDSKFVLPQAPLISGSANDIPFQQDVMIFEKNLTRSIFSEFQR